MARTAEAKAEGARAEGAGAAETGTRDGRAPTVPGVVSLAGLALGIALAVVVTAGSWHHTVDDGDIVVRYVVNLRAGRGWVWNVGSVRNACTSTLHPALVLLVSFLGIGVTAAAHVVGGVALAGSSVAAFLLLRRLRLPGAACVAAVALPLLPLWQGTWGLETPVFVGLLLAHGAAVAGGRTRWWTVAGCALTRPDGAVLLVTSAVRERRATGRWPLAGLIGVVLAVLAVLQIAVLRTGSLLPASVGAKHDQGTQQAFRQAFPYLPELVTQLQQACGGADQAIVVAAAAGAGLVACVLTGRTAPVELAVAVGLQTLVFAAAGVPGYYWYYDPLFVVLGLLSLVAVELALGNAAALVRRRGALPRLVALTGVIAGAAAALTTWLPQVSISEDPRESSYVAAAQWLTAQGPVTSVGVGEVGVYGVQLPTARVVDLIGLVTAIPYWEACCTEELLRDPPQWLVLHVSATPGSGAAGASLAALEREADLTIDGTPRTPGTGVPALWPVDNPIVAAPGFQRVYRLVHSVVVPGASPQAVFERR